MAEGQGPEDLAHKLLKCLHGAGSMLLWDKVLGQISIANSEGEGMADNLILKGSTWHVRLELPEDVRHAFGYRRKLTKSLKTGNKAEAQIKKLATLGQWKSLIEQTRKGMPASSVEEILEHRHKAVPYIMNLNKERVMNHAYGVEVITKEDVEHSTELYKATVEEIFSGDINEKNNWLEKLEQNEQQFSENEKASTEAVVNYFTLLEELFIYSEAFHLKNKGYNINQIEQITDVIKKPEIYSPKSILTDNKLELFAKHQLEIKGLAPKTVDGFISKLKTLRVYLEENGADITFDSYHNFLDSIAKSVKTKKNHINAGSNFHKWASKYDADYKARYDTKENPFLGHELPKERKKGKKIVENRLAFKVSEIKPIYNAIIKKQKYQVANAMKIAFYTGCRIEEICQLKKEHIILEEKIKCLYIEEGKTNASIRKIPIHPSLQPLINELEANASSDYLIHSSGGNKYGIRSDNISKAFSRIKTGMGYGEQHVFHSIRKTVITALQHNNIAPLIISSIVGHETGTVTFDIYSEGASAKQKYDAIKTLPSI